MSLNRAEQEWPSETTQDIPLTHFTMTGYYAGTVFCGAKRVEGNKYLHAAYAPIEKLERGELADYPALCPECLKMWNEAGD